MATLIAQLQERILSLEVDIQTLRQGHQPRTKEILILKKAIEAIKAEIQAIEEGRPERPYSRPEGGVKRHGSLE